MVWVVFLGIFVLFCCMYMMVMKLFQHIEDKDYEYRYKRRLRMQKKYGGCCCNSVDCEDQQRGL